MGSRAGLDAVAKRKNPCPCRESNPGRTAFSLVTILVELPLTHFHVFIFIINSN